MKIAIYARSSVDGNVSSLEKQVSLCESWSIKNGYTIVGNYLDETIINEPVFQRPGLSKMFESIVLNNVFLVIIEHTSVISESTDFVDAFYARMAYLKVTVETIKANTFTPWASALPLSKAEVKRRQFSDKTRQSIVTSALTGIIPGGKIYGYNPETGFRVISIAEARIINQIYKMFLEGSSPLKISRELNEKSVQSPQGRDWNKATLLGSRERKTGLLRQTLYGGVFTFNKMAYKTHPVTGKRFSVVRPENEWIKIPLPELALVSLDLFNDVQNKIDQTEAKRPSARKNRKNMSEDEKLLYDKVSKEKSLIKKGRIGKRLKQIYSKNLVCGNCGSRIAAERATYNSCTSKKCENKLIDRLKMVSEIYSSILAITYSDFMADISKLLSKKEGKENKKLELVEKYSELEGFYRSKKQSPTSDNSYSAELQAVRLEINNLAAEIESYSLEFYNDNNSEEIYKKFMKQTEYCQANPEASLEIEQIRSCVITIQVTKASNNKIEVELGLNISKILILFLG